MSRKAPEIEARILTANRLSDGHAVFLAPTGAWVERIWDALVVREGEDAQPLEAQAARDVARNLIVEPYFIDLREEGGCLVPVRYRERVRCLGPTVGTDLATGASPSEEAMVRVVNGGSDGRAEAA
jgi:hypothetical protein